MRKSATHTNILEFLNFKFQHTLSEFAVVLMKSSFIKLDFRVSYLVKMTDDATPKETMSFNVNNNVNDNVQQVRKY